MYRIDHSLRVGYLAPSEIIPRNTLLGEYLATYPTRRRGLTDLRHCECVKPIAVAEQPATCCKRYPH